MLNILYNNYKKGFTLSELMIAALILAFALVGLLSLFIACLFLNESSRNLSLAYSAIQTEMEDLSVITSLADYTALGPLDGEVGPLTGFGAGRGVYELTVIDDPDGVSGDLKRITIRACYMNRNRLVGTVAGYTAGGDIDNCQSSPVELITSIARP